MHRRRLTIGGAVDLCVKATTEEWFRQHGGHRSREEAFTEGVNVVTIEAKRFSGGLLEVRVGVVAHVRHEQLVNWTPFKLSESAGYQPSKNPNPKR